MDTRQQILTREQADLVADLSTAYSIDPSEVIFFTNDPEPFLGYEATCVLCNALIPDLDRIEIEPAESLFADSIAFRCVLGFAGGRVRSAVGVANKSEQIDGHSLTDSQLQQTASARAIRNTLRAAGKNLFRLHRESSVDVAPGVLPQRPESNRTKLLARAHALGQDAGLIDNGDREHWCRILLNRYGVTSSGDLAEESLADFVAFLAALATPRNRAA